MKRNAKQVGETSSLGSLRSRKQQFHKQGREMLDNYIDRTVCTVIRYFTPTESVLAHRAPQDIGLPYLLGLINTQRCVSQTQQNFIMFIIVLGQHVSTLIESSSGPSEIQILT